MMTVCTAWDAVDKPCIGVCARYSHLCGGHMYGPTCTARRWDRWAAVSHRRSRGAVRATTSAAFPVSGEKVPSSATCHVSVSVRL